MSILREELITNHLLLDYFDLWDEFDIKSANDTREVRYYNQLMNLINGQLDAGIRWLDSDEAKEYFTGETEYQREVFRALEDEWDSILESKYNSVDALLSEVYRRGKAKGYSDMRSRIRYTPQDKLALDFVTNYNFGLIRNIDSDVRSQIKGKIISGFLAGDHPNTIAPKISAIAGERLDGSNFTPKQRATMIARTEISRVQNTGILQSYVNEGYTEVKILTAEDSNVCTTCLKYAFEFNKDDDITFENRGDERVHNIFKLIKGGLFPPFHPLCRCTYLSVWKSKGEPPEEPYIINLTPMKFLDSTGEHVLSDGKPNIKWTEESLNEQLKCFVDNEKELNVLTDFLMDYMENIENRNIEYLNAIDNEFNIVCNQHTLNKSGGVDLCQKGKEASDGMGLLAIIHNHPSNNPLHSQGDVNGVDFYDMKYSFIFTEETGLLALKIDENNSGNIIKGYDEFYEDMYSYYKKSNSTEYNHLLDLLQYGGLKHEEFEKRLNNNIKNFISSNVSLSLTIFKQKMIENKVPMIHIKP